MPEEANQQQADRSSPLWKSLQALTNGLGVQRLDLYKAGVLSQELCQLWHIYLEHDSPATVQAKVIWQVERLFEQMPPSTKTSIVGVCFNLADVNGRTVKGNLSARQEILSRRPELGGRGAKAGPSKSTIQRYLNEAIDTFYEELRRNPPPAVPADVLPKVEQQAPKSPAAEFPPAMRPKYSGVLTNPIFLAGVGLATAVVVVVPGAFWVRAQLVGDDKQQSMQSPLPSLTVNDGSSGPMAPVPVTQPPVTDARLAITSETNPYKLSEPELIERYKGEQDWLAPKGKTVQGQPELAADGGFYRFAQSRGTVAVNRLFFGFNVQSLTGGSVLLRGLHVANLKCGPSLKGTRIFTGGGAEGKPVRVILIDLNERFPVPLFVKDLSADELNAFLKGGKISPQRADPFSFTLAKEESEPFDVLARVSNRSCSFTLAIDAIINGQKKTLSVTDDRQPFRITGDRDGITWFYPSVDANGQPAWGLIDYPKSTIATKTVSINQPLPETDP